MEYNVTQPGKVRKEIWNEKTVHVLSGGFNIVGFLSFAALGFLPKGIPLFLDHTLRTATPIKGAVLTLALGATDETAQVKKGHVFAVGDFIGNATKAVTIEGINTSNAAYDVITLSEAIGAVSVGGTLFSATEEGAAKVLKATALNYADVKWKVSKAACSAVIQAYEVRNSLLPYPLTATQISELTSRFYVVA